MITKILILLCMIFFHIIDDFHLQGCLAQLKQKSWWASQIETLFANQSKKILEDPDYTSEVDYTRFVNDWIPALLAHCFQWTFMIMIPVMAYYLYTNISFTIDFFLLFILNIVIHFITDNAKCNQMKINLIEDQTVHLFQIVCTWFFLIGA